MRPDTLVTGFSSIGAGGAVAGLPGPALQAEPELITRWVTPGPRRAFLVPPFRPTDVVPGLRTRRLDRLSVWALVGTALALRDADIDVTALDPERTAVVVGTAFGCLELTEQFLAGLQSNAARADPIVFPETLSNQPGSHVARHFGIRGPNVSVSAESASGETALIEAASLLHAMEADRVIVLAGDLITQSLFEWYEAAGALAPACYGEPERANGAKTGTRVPGEGLVACVIETRDVARQRQARTYGRYHGGWVGPRHETARQSGVVDLSALLNRMAPGTDPEDVEFIACPPAGHPDVAGGTFGGRGLLHLGLALGRLRESEQGYVLVAGTTDCGQHGALLAGKDRS